MKPLFLIFLLISSFFINGQQINKTETDIKGKLFLIGKTDKKAFDSESFSRFQKNNEAYITNDNVIEKFKDSLQNYTIKAFYGTWCF